MRKKCFRRVCAWILAGILTAECLPADFMRISGGKNGSAEKQAEAAQVMTAQTEQSRLQGNERASSVESIRLQAAEQSCLLPTEEELKQWQEDGSLEQRQEFMESLGMQGASLKDFSQEAVSTVGLDEDYPTVWTEGMPTTGNVKSLVFLVDFPDMPNDGVTPEDVETMLFSEEDTESPEYPYESLSAYYKRSSYGKLNISGEVYGWLTMAHEREYYNGEDAEAGRQKMIQEILNAYDDEIDFSQYDSDKDGMIDSIYIYYAGGTTGWGEQWWSYVASGPTAWEFADGMKMKKYCFFGDMSTITAIHETGHLLGLPDYYDYERGFNLNGEAGGIGWIDMMDNNYCDHNIFSKMLLGWVEPVFITEDQKIELAGSSSGEAKAVIVTKDKNKNIFSEYYLLEFYQKKGNNVKIVTEGDGAVRIYHIDATLNEEKTDFICDNSYTEHKLIKLIESDGLEQNGIYGYPIPTGKYYTEGMELGVNTYPGSDFYGGNYTGININIDDITGEKARIGISFQDADQKKPVFSGKVKQKSSAGHMNKMVDFQMYFDSPIYKGENLGEVKLFDKDGKEIDISAEIFNPRLDAMGTGSFAGTYDTQDRYNILQLNSGMLENGREYTVQVPENAVKDSAGNGNDAYFYSFCSGVSKEVKQIVSCDESNENLIQKGNTQWLWLENGTVLCCQLYSNLLDFTDTTKYLFLKEYDANGNVLWKKNLEIESNEDEMLQGMYLWKENEILLVFGKQYISISIEGEVVCSGNLFEGFVSSDYWIREFEDKIIYVAYCFDGIETGDNYFDYEICTFYVNNGEIKHEKRHMLFFNWDYYDENLEVEIDKYEEWKQNRENMVNKQAYLFEEKSMDQVLIEGYGNMPPFYWHQGKRLLDARKKIDFVRYSPAFDQLSRMHSDQCLIEQIDDSYHKVMDVKIAEDCLFGGMITLSQGYLVYISQNEMRSWKQDMTFIRLDDELNVLWKADEEVKGDFLRVVSEDGKINIFTSFSWIQINDTQDVLYSSEDLTEFMENTDQYSVDKEKKTITLKQSMSVDELKKIVLGNASEVIVYNEEYEEVKKGDVMIENGLMKVTKQGEIYSYYYQLESGALGDVNGDGSINSTDALLVLKIAARILMLPEGQMKAADVNLDGNVNSTDALLILKYAANLIQEFGKTQA